MKRALRLAAKGLGRTSPNPAVGCVIVKAGKVVGEGFHRRAGGPHAEAEALRVAGTRAKGATCYITLQPCHRQGRTGPCTVLLLRSKVGRVVAACEDPNMSSAGWHALRSAGIETEVGLCEEEARELNRAFLKWASAGIPYVTLKLAMSLDGKIADFAGRSRWITNEKARKEAHKLRFLSDAVLVGAETALRDRPSLQPYLLRKRKVTRAVLLDTHLRLGSRVQAISYENPLIYHSEKAGASRRRRLEGVAELVECPVAESGLDPNWILRDLARRQVLHLLVEGGGRVASTFLENSLVDEAYLFYAPKVAGDPKARAAFSGFPGKMLADWTTGRLLAVRNVSGNILARISFESVRDV